MSAYAAPAPLSWRAIDWPAHEQWFDVEGRRLRYIDIGSGHEAVLFVHGLSGSWHWWLETLPAIAEHRRVIAVDLPGCGSSQMPARPLTLALWCEQLDALCAHLDLDRVTVAGFSLGTVVAPQMAIRHPERVSKLVLVGGPLLSLDRVLRDRGATARRQPRMVAVVLSELLSVPIPLPAALARQVASRPRLRKLALRAYARNPEQLHAGLVHHLLSGIGAPGVVASVQACISRPLYDRLEEIACPVLAINGKHDALVPADDVAELGRRLPHAQTIVFDDAAHWPQIERPDDFNAELLSFLDA